jgi:hypothetical protein
MIEIDWNTYFDKLFPNIGSMYFTERQMKAVNKKLYERNEQLLITEKQYPTCIYDLMARIVHPGIGSLKEKAVAAGLLTSIDGAIGKLSELMLGDVFLLSQLKKQLKDLFNDNEAKYLEKIGELFASIHLIESYPNHTLKSFEYKYEKVDGKISNKGKDADLYFQGKNIENSILIDVVNISLDYRRIESNAGLETIISDRIRSKIKAKRFDEQDVVKHYGQAMVQPFLWVYDWGTILRFKSSLKKTYFSNSLPILILTQQSDASGNLSYKCINVNDL